MDETPNRTHPEGERELPCANMTGSTIIRLSDAMTKPAEIVDSGTNTRNAISSRLRLGKAVAS
jgi:hypothetical protein